MIRTSICNQQMTMKKCMLLLLIIWPFLTDAKDKQYTIIDKYSSSVDYIGLDSLANKLTAPFSNDSEKVRSIFYWITQHISYDVYQYHHPVTQHFGTLGFEDSAEAVSAFCALNAEKVIEKRMGVCEDYADLFKALCDKNRIECVKISGYAKTDLDKIGKPIDENHAWNAVKINGDWKLIDACWASGYTNTAITEFTKEFKEYYYCTPPEMFVLNHYPSDSNWQLTNRHISISDFFNYPLPFFDRDKLNIEQFSPQNGIITAKIGEVIKIELSFRNELDSFSERDGSYISEYDATGKSIKPFVGLTKYQKFRSTDNKLYYEYKVMSARVNELTLVYNSDFLFSYKLIVSK